MKAFVLILLAFYLSACAAKFSGYDMEVSTGTEQGVDQGQPTHKMVYGVLGRVRMDVSK